MIEEGLTYNTITPISSSIGFNKKNAQQHKNEKKKFAEILEEKSHSDNEPAGKSHIDITY